MFKKKNCFFNNFHYSNFCVSEGAVLISSDNRGSTVYIKIVFIVFCKENKISFKCITLILTLSCYWINLKNKYLRKNVPASQKYE